MNSSDWRQEILKDPAKIKLAREIYFEALYLQKLFKLKGKGRKEFRRKHFADNHYIPH